MIELLFLVISIALVLICGIFVAAEFSFITVNRHQVERLALKGDRKAKGILHGLKTLSTQLSGAQVGITITNLAIGLLTEPAVAYYIEGPLLALGLSEKLVSSLSITLAIVLASAVTMVFGELVPKKFAITKPLETAKFVQGVHRKFTWLMHFPILFLNGTANLILKRFNVQPQEELASARSGGELLAVVRHSAKRGTLANETAQMLVKSFEFSDKNAAEVATPRVRLITIDLDESVSEVVKLAKDSGYSRFPVTHDGIDDIVGIVHIKHAVKVPYEDRKKVQVKDVMEPALFVPSSVDLDSFMEKLQAHKMQMAVTIDEFGGTDGVVTMEDLLEELVGEVRDEHDRYRASIRQLNDTSWLLTGLLRSDEVTEVTNIVMPEDEDFETMGGLLLDKLEEIPDVGDSIYLNTVDRNGKRLRIRLSVHSMDGHRVDRLILEVVPAEKKANAEPSAQENSL